MNKTLNEMTIPELVDKYEELKEAYEFAHDLGQESVDSIYDTALLVQAELNSRMVA